MCKNKIDLLNRENFITNVIRLVNQLSENRRGCCFAIEGTWGIGKTFVIENVEEQLKLIQCEKMRGDRYFVFHYNCWQHDYYEEPAISIISAMIASIEKDNEIMNEEMDGLAKAGWKIVRDKLNEIAGIYIENKIGVNLISLIEDASNIKESNKNAEFQFDKMFNFSQTIEKVRKNYYNYLVKQNLQE